FDEQFGSGTSFACEDIDAIAASLWAGIAGAFDPRPTVYHHHGRKTDREARDLWKIYDKGRGAYYTKYLLRGDSRSAYLRYWAHSVTNGLRGASMGARREHLVTVRRFLREFFGGLHYVAARVWKRASTST